MCEDIKNGLSEETIKKIQEIYDKREQIKKEGEDYIIFRVIKAERKEPVMTDILADFLNYEEPKTKRKIFLDLFMEKVLEYTCPEKINDIKVTSQYSTKCDDCPGKRIDIVIEINDVKMQKFIPIEAKIYSSVGVGQLENYYNEAVWYNKEKFGQNAENAKNNAKVFFLTLDCQKTDDIDDKGLGDNIKKAMKDKKKPIECITWKEHISNWLKECQIKCRTASVAMIMKQFQLDIVRWLGIKEEMNRLDEIFKDQTHQNEALKIWKDYDNEKDKNSWKSIVWEYVEAKKNHVRQDFLDIVDKWMKEKQGAAVDNHAEKYSRYLFKVVNKDYLIGIDLEPYLHKTKITASVFEYKNNKLQYVKPEKYQDDLKLKFPKPRARYLGFGEYKMQENVFNINGSVEKCEGELTKILDVIRSNVQNIKKS